MASDADPIPSIFKSPRANLSIRSMPRLLQSPQRSGTLTPPLHATVSVPFRWEQEPGKPIPSTALTILPNPTSLELPPRLLFNLTKLPSSTTAATVFDDHFISSRPKFQSSSFRMAGRESYETSSPEKGQLGAMILSKRYHQKDKNGWFGGSWRRKKLGLKSNTEFTGGSYVFPSSVDRHSDTSSMKRIRKAGSLSSLAPPRSQFWSTIYGSLKQGMSWNWKSKKMKKISS